MIDSEAEAAPGDKPRAHNKGIATAGKTVKPVRLIPNPLMQWYYAINGERLGPVTDPAFRALVKDGTIKPETLVWHQSMANWLPYGQVAPATIVPGAGPPTSAAVRSMDDASPAQDRSPEPLLFTGEWKEYFKIWIVNVLLTVVTLGIYAAWAKVRKKRYFYANTQIFGHVFEYHAEPKRILIGNLIVVGLFIAYSMSGAISPLVQLPLMLLIAVAVPWMIVRSIGFNARNSSWRGLRFQFNGRYGQALVSFILMPIVTVFTLGALHPMSAKMRKEFLVKNHAYGTTSFGLDAPTGAYYRLYLLAALFFLPIVLCYGGIIATVAMQTVPNGGQAPAEIPPAFAYFGLLMFVAVPVAIVGTFFLRARLFNLVWNHTSLSGHRFNATMKARNLILLHFVNSLVVLLTLGLLHPWAAVRMAKFQLDSLQVVPAGSLDEFVAASQPEIGALGEAASDFFDFDIGVGV